MQNARQMDETAASVQGGRAARGRTGSDQQRPAGTGSRLDMQGIYDAVGDKIREIFDRDNLVLRVIDRHTGMLHYPYLYELGERISVEPTPVSGMMAHVLRTGRSLVINENMEEAAAKLGAPNIPGTAPEKSGVWVPLIWGGEIRGLISIPNYETEHAFGDSDVRLLETLAGALSAALENAELFARDAAVVRRERAAGGRTGHRQQRPAGAGFRARHARDLRRRRPHHPRDVPRSRHRHPRVRPHQPGWSISLTSTTRVSASASSR